MKSLTNSLVLFCLLTFGGIETALCEPIARSKTEKLIDAVWKEPPRQVDITLYKEILQPPESEDKIRSMFEEIFIKTYGPKEKLSGQNLENFNRDVQMNVERTLKEQQGGKRLKQRIRIDGYRQRIDQIFAQPRMVLLEGTPNENIVPEVVLDSNTSYDTTFINAGDNSKRDYTSFVYYHENKTAQIHHAKDQMWAKKDIVELGRFPTTIFKSLLGRQEITQNGYIYVPDEGKIADLNNTGKVGLLNIGIYTDPNAPDKREIIKMKNNEGINTMTLVCDREDYSRIYDMQTKSASGNILYHRECNNFDSQGFPRNIKVTEFDSNGNCTKKESYVIEKANLTPSISEDVFAFNPPDDYEIVETDVNGITKVVREKGGIDGAMQQLSKAQKEMDIEALKNLLGHKIWQIRLRSLQVLESILIKQNPTELKEAATILNNDENPEVRKKSTEIIKRIDRRNSVKKTSLPEKQ